MNRFHPSISWDSSPDSASSQLGMDDDGGPETAANDMGVAGPGTLRAEDCERVAGRAFLLPVHYEPNYRYPLIIWFHSDGYNEHQLEDVMPHVSLRNYVGVGIRGVRAADSVGHRYDWSFSRAGVDAAQAAVAETVQEAASRFSIHPERVILAGYRDGGTMALRVALAEPDAFAAVISLGGSLPRCGGVLRNLAALRRRRMPMLWQWARLGARFDHDRFSDDLQMAMWMRAQLEVRQYEDDDEMNTVALADLNDWIMRRVVTGTGEPDRWASAEVPFSNN